MTRLGELCLGIGKSSRRGNLQRRGTSAPQALKPDSGKSAPQTMKPDIGNSSRLGKLLGLGKCDRSGPANGPKKAATKRPVASTTSHTPSKKHKTEKLDLNCPAVESDYHHRLRHPTFLPKCIRCNFKKHARSWQALSVHAGLTAETNRSWLSERPSFMGGGWALGCSICTWAANDGVPKHKRSNRPRHRLSKWARFQIRRLRTCSEAASAISNHQSSASHRRAVKMMQSQSSRPPQHGHDKVEASANTAAANCNVNGSRVVGAGLAASEGDIDALTLLKGRVPQLADWIDAWASATNRTSYRKQERLKHKKGEVRKAVCLRKRLRKQVRILAEVTRTSIRQALTAARSITFAMDSRGEHKVLRFRCDTDHPPYRMDGVIGVYHCGFSDMSAAEDDHGMRMLRNLQACIAEFWTPLGGQCMVDEQIAMLAKVRCLTSDGCAVERKMLFLCCQTICKNVVVVLRDYAHAARIAVKQPVKFDRELGVVHTYLFDKKHAVIPDIQYSSKLKDLLVAAQNIQVRMPETRSPLKVVLRHLSFAKHRFDSMADPVAKTACMLLPLCTLLSAVSCDVRVKPEKRARAVEGLKLFTPKCSLTLGVLADYGLLTAAFIRKYDKMDHDIACCARELDDFALQMRKVFCEGWVFASHTDIADVRQEQNLRELRGQFMVDIVRSQTKNQYVFNAGQCQALVWGRCSNTEVCDLAKRIAFATEVMLERLYADFHADQLREAFQCFDLRRLSAGRLDRHPSEESAVDRQARKRCLDGLKTLASAMGLDPVRTLQEYLDVAPAIYQTEEKERLDDADNRRAWSRLYDAGFMSRFDNRIERIELLPTLVAVYNSVLDGECQVERDLGAVLALSREHTNLANDGLSDLLTLSASGPKSCDCFGNVISGSITEHTKKCLRLWRRIHGCRYGTYDVKGRKLQRPTPPPQGGTFASVKRGVFSAAKARLKLHRSRKPVPKLILGDDAPLQCTPVGELSKSTLCTPEHKRFLQQSKDKIMKANAARRCRQSGQTPFPKPKLRFSAPIFPGWAQ